MSDGLTRENHTTLFETCEKWDSSSNDDKFCGFFCTSVAGRLSSDFRMYNEDHSSDDEIGIYAKNSLVLPVFRQ